MTKILFLILLLQVFTPALLSAQREIVFDPELKMTQLNDHVWVVTHSFPWDSNSLVVQASDKEVVLIDTPYTNEATETLLKYIQEKLKPKRITAILTGFHVDNLGGTGSLLKRGIPVYGADRTCVLIDEKSASTQRQLLSWLKAPEQEKYRQAYASMKFEKPDRVFPIEKGLFLKKGKLSFEVYFPGESHSPDNLTVYLKELDLLFGGCMVKSLESRNLGFTGDANMNEWPVSLKKVQAKYPNAKLVIPHHGQWGDAALLRHTLDLFNAR
jgi:glyoxylase-like metal-dependent hydrolase (beta-lactamase superfamily II)